MSCTRLSRLLDPAVGSPRSWFLDKVKGAAEFQAGTTKALEGIKAVDRYTVQITLSEPFAPFISILGLPHTSIVPREEVERLGADFATAPVGTGPFRFVRWDRGREIVLEANEHYFRGRPALDRIRFRHLSGSNAEAICCKPLSEENWRKAPFLRSDGRNCSKRASIKSSGSRRSASGSSASTSSVPRFDQREVRQAFNYAIDKVRLNQEIQGERYVVARGILPPGMPGYNPEVQGYSYDPDKAKELLAQAGYPGGKDLAPVTLASSCEINRDTPGVSSQYSSIWRPSGSRSSCRNSMIGQPSNAH